MNPWFIHNFALDKGIIGHCFVYLSKSEVQIWTTGVTELTRCSCKRSAQPWQDGTVLGSLERTMFLVALFASTLYNDVQHPRLKPDPILIYILSKSHPVFTFIHDSFEMPPRSHMAGFWNTDISSWPSTMDLQFTTPVTFIILIIIYWAVSTWFWPPPTPRLSDFLNAKFEKSPTQFIGLLFACHVYISSLAAVMHHFIADWVGNPASTLSFFVWLSNPWYFPLIASPWSSCTHSILYSRQQHRYYQTKSQPFHFRLRLVC